MGEAVSIYSQDCLLHQPLVTHILVDAGRAKIGCYGSHMLALQFGQKQFTWSFTTSEVKKPILGADFLSPCGLTVKV